MLLNIILLEALQCSEFDVVQHVTMICH